MSTDTITGPRNSRRLARVDYVALNGGTQDEDEDDEEAFSASPPRRARAKRANAPRAAKPAPAAKPAKAAEPAKAAKAAKPVKAGKAAAARAAKAAIAAASRRLQLLGTETTEISDDQRALVDSVLASGSRTPPRPRPAVDTARVEPTEEIESHPRTPLAESPPAPRSPLAEAEADADEERPASPRAIETERALANRSPSPPPHVLRAFDEAEDAEPAAACVPADVWRRCYSRSVGSGDAASDDAQTVSFYDLLEPRRDAAFLVRMQARSYSACLRKVEQMFPLHFYPADAEALANSLRAHEGFTTAQQNAVLNRLARPDAASRLRFVDAPLTGAEQLKFARLPRTVFVFDCELHTFEKAQYIREIACMSLDGARAFSSPVCYLRPIHESYKAVAQLPNHAFERSELGLVDRLNRDDRRAHELSDLDTAPSFASAFCDMLRFVQVASGNRQALVLYQGTTDPTTLVSNLCEPNERFMPAEATRNALEALAQVRPRWQSVDEFWKAMNSLFFLDAKSRSLPKITEFMFFPKRRRDGSGVHALWRDSEHEALRQALTAHAARAVAEEGPMPPAAHRVSLAFTTLRAPAGALMPNLDAPAGESKKPDGSSTALEKELPQALPEDRRHGVGRETPYAFAAQYVRRLQEPDFHHADGDCIILRNNLAGMLLFWLYLERVQARMQPALALLAQETERAAARRQAQERVPAGAAAAFEAAVLEAVKRAAVGDAALAQVLVFLFRDLHAAVQSETADGELKRRFGVVFHLFQLALAALTADFTARALPFSARMTAVLLAYAAPLRVFGLQSPTGCVRLETVAPNDMAAQAASEEKAEQHFVFDMQSAHEFFAAWDGRARFHEGKRQAQQLAGLRQSMVDGRLASATLVHRLHAFYAAAMIDDPSRSPAERRRALNDAVWERRNWPLFCISNTGRGHNVTRIHNRFCHSLLTCVRFDDEAGRTHELRAYLFSKAQADIQIFTRYDAIAHSADADVRFCKACKRFEAAKDRLVTGMRVRELADVDDERTEQHAWLVRFGFEALAAPAGPIAAAPLAAMPALEALPPPAPLAFMPGLAPPPPDPRFGAPFATGLGAPFASSLGAPFAPSLGAPWGSAPYQSPFGYAPYGFGFGYARPPPLPPLPLSAAAAFSSAAPTAAGRARPRARSARRAAPEPTVKLEDDEDVSVLATGPKAARTHRMEDKLGFAVPDGMRAVSPEEALALLREMLAAKRPPASGGSKESVTSFVAPTQYKRLSDALFGLLLHFARMGYAWEAPDVERTIEVVQWAVLFCPSAQKLAQWEAFHGARLCDPRTFVHMLLHMQQAASSTPRRLGYAQIRALQGLASVAGLVDRAASDAHWPLFRVLYESGPLARAVRLFDQQVADAR